MAATEGWTERTWRSGDSGRANPHVAKRSLKAALAEAGLGDPPAKVRARRQPIERVPQTSAPVTARPVEEDVRPPLASPPRVAHFVDQVPPQPPQGVVSPPPWLREARRGRIHALLLNTFGWMMALVVAGSIIGLAGHYLAVTPPGVDTMHTARQ